MRSHLNLLPIEYRRRDLLRRRLVQWSALGALGGLAALGAWSMKQANLRGAEKAAAAAQRSYAPLQKLAVECKTMRAEVQQLRTKENLLGQLRDERSLFVLLGLVGSSAQRCDGRLVIHSFDFQWNQQPDADPAESAPANRGRPRGGGPPMPEPQSQPSAVVTLEGDALDNLAIATFVVALRDTGIFRRVELKSSLEKSSHDAEVQSYAVQGDI